MNTRQALRWNVAMSVTLLLGIAGAAAGSQTPASAPAPAAQRPPKGAAPKPATANSAQFDEVVKEATTARQAEQWEDAAALFTKAVKLRPDYAEGYWYQGAAYTSSTSSRSAAIPSGA